MYQRDGLETVTFKSRQPGTPTTFMTWTLPRVFFRALTKDEASQAGVTAAQMRVIQVFAVALANATAISPATGAAPNPKQRDEFLRGDGTLWIATPRNAPIAVIQMEQAFDVMVMQAPPGGASP